MITGSDTKTSCKVVRNSPDKSVVLQGHVDEGVNSEDSRNGDNKKRNPLDFIQNVLQLYGRK